LPDHRLIGDHNREAVSFNVFGDQLPREARSAASAS
jgi:hypothetical protein